jgi:hypothetical protein
VNRHRARQGIKLSCGLLIAAALLRTGAASDFRFDRDTLAFANSTVFEYREGVAQLRRNERRQEKSSRYTRRCFVMSRTAIQFHKFARFDPKGASLNDEELARRVRKVTRQSPWHDPLPDTQRIVFPGCRHLRELSKTRGRVLQENIGLGWPTYLRVGNFRMFFNHGVKYQEQTHQELDATLAGGQLFVAYLSDYPTLHINHSVLVYARKPPTSNGRSESYLCYDPNHPDAPRELIWFPATRVFNYQKDEEFVGGYTRVYHVYGKPWQ